MPFGAPAGIDFVKFRPVPEVIPQAGVEQDDALALGCILFQRGAESDVGKCSLIGAENQHIGFC